MSLIISTKTPNIVNGSFQQKNYTEYVHFGSTRAAELATDADTRRYLANVNSNGGVITASTLQAIDIFVKKLKADLIWNKLSEIGPLAGTDIRAALTKLKYVTTSPYLTNVNFVTADYTERGSTGGFKGNGSSKYLDTGYAGNYTADNGHIGIYIKGTEASGTSRVAMGRENSGGSIFSYLGWINGGAWDVGVLVGNAAPGNYTPQTPESTYKKEGLFLVATNGTLSQQFYTNASAVGSPVLTASVSLPTSSFYLLADNSNGTPTLYSTRYLRYYTIGAGLSASDVANYNAAIQALQIALSRAV